MLNKAVGIGFVSGAMIAAGVSSVTKKIAQKSGKAVGLPGSINHVLTNDKLDKSEKKEVIKEINKEHNKNCIKLLGGVLQIAGAAAVATSCSPTFEKAATKLTKLPILKDIVNAISNSQKSKKLPVPAKVACAIGSMVLTLLTPIVVAGSAAKAGYIEAKHEA